MSHDQRIHSVIHDSNHKKKQKYFNGAQWCRVKKRSTWNRLSKQVYQRLSADQISESEWWACSGFLCYHHKMIHQLQVTMKSNGSSTILLEQFDYDNL